MTGTIAFALLLIPTLLMGSTLPLLVEHIVRRTGNVGESVGSLYSVNTFGSGVACLAAAFFLMRLFGEGGTVRLACCLNLTVGAVAILSALRSTNSSAHRNSPAQTEPAHTIPLWVGMVLAGIIGFIALAYEIIWYRLYSFTRGCFLALTVLATLGSGQHYAFDLFSAVPYAVAIIGLSKLSFFEPKSERVAITYEA